MNGIREKICRECIYRERRMLTSNHHPDLPYCKQPVYPLDAYEWERLGASPQDEITLEGVRKMMEISIRPYCREKMLKAHPIEYWYERLKFG